MPSPRALESGINHLAGAAARNSRTWFKHRTRFGTCSRTWGSSTRTWKWSQNHGGSHLRRAPQYETREPGSKTEPGSAQSSHVGTHAKRLAGRRSNQVREFRTRAAHFETTSWFAGFSADRKGPNSALPL